ncbi:hypothetical protein [Lapidilactobacillus wuchangensis]|uniref:hypothetical protein n=1 Tax=Lapidilactobacillus wuchangensis TaxID=2486001 RepID=UPI000F7B92A5|nr:hypothetical protein [Lapidilactobacillus wuchangensis]
MNGAIEDADYLEQQALVDFGILPEDFEKSDHIRMNEILSAKPKDKRAVDAFEFMNSLRKGGR